MDRTKGREDTFYDGPQTTHVSGAEPYCPDLTRVLAEADPKARTGGTVVVVQGPRFSTRAESRWFASAGWDVVNMTQYPEAWLARELELCYVNLMLVTDFDAGLEGRRSSCAPGQAGCFAQEPDVPPVSADMAFEVFSRNLDRLRALLFRAVPRIGPQPECVCASALGSAVMH